MDVPDSLKEKVELFRLNGQIFREEDELFTETSWAAVMMGQGIAMKGHNPMAERIPADKLKGEFDEIEKSVRFVVDRMPAHGDYVARYCPAAQCTQ
jgi:tryptophan halogenase